MTYTGAETARTSRERLGQALAALQQHADIPDDVMAVASNVAQAIGALFEAERASSDLDGRASVKNALGTLGQTLALLQDVPDVYKARLEPAVEAIAGCMGALYPLAHAPARHSAPPGPAVTSVGHMAPSAAAPQPSGGYAQPAYQQPAHQQPAYQQPAYQQPAYQQPAYQQPAYQQPAPVQPAHQPPAAPFVPGQRTALEANIGATTESNFFVGFSGEVAEGGVFLATYDVLPVRTSVQVLVTLPGGFEFSVNGWVRYVRDPFDFSADSNPGMGIQFEGLNGQDRELIMRFIRKRAPTFYDD